MKVLCASVFKDGTGYAHAAIQLALACEAAGLDVVCRSISLSPTLGVEAAKSIAHLESKSLQGVDAVIQYSLPHTFEYKRGVKNIGVFCWETTHFSRSSWANSCNLMDEIWVPCRQTEHACKRSGVTVPIRVIPTPFDSTRVNQVQEPLFSHPLLKDRTIFYTIGEYVRRKNVVGVVRAYYNAFSARDNVVLLIKTTVPGMSPQQGLAYMRSMCEDVRKSMHVYPDARMYPPVLVLTDYLSPEMIDRVHITGDCFVSATHGEAWCVPAHDAMAFWTPVIAPAWGAFPDLMDGEGKCRFDEDRSVFDHPREVKGGYLLGGHLVPCFAPDSGFTDLYTGAERWFEPDLGQMAEHMRSFHELNNQGVTDERWALKSRAHDRALAFSREAVASLVAKTLGE